MDTNQTTSPDSSSTDAPLLSADEAKRRRQLLLVAAGLLAGFGLAYELALMLLGTVTVGATEQANAVVLGVGMAGMGVGAVTGGRLAKRPLRSFVTIEVLLAVVGAAAIPLLYYTWAALSAFWGPLLMVTFTIGWLIGAEMPLLAALNDRLAAQSPQKVIADYTAADYFGALAGSLLFGFLVRPVLGLTYGVAVVAAGNLLIAAAAAWLMRPAVPTARRRHLTAVLVAGTMAVAALTLAAQPTIDRGLQRLYRDPVIAHTESAVQQIVVTSRTHRDGRNDTRLFLNGDLQLSTIDESRYHEPLVHPALAAADNPKRVVVFGGGDCMAVREVLNHPTVEHVTLVELDPAVVELAQTLPALVTANNDACSDPRVELIHTDAFTWIRQFDRRPYDTAIVDFPDPDTPALGRLYSVELYTMMDAVVAQKGVMVVQCGSPFFATKAYWTCQTTLRAAGWHTTPYNIDVPSFGNWGFHLASRHQPPPLQLTSDSQLEQPRTFLTGPVLQAAAVFGRDIAAHTVHTEPSTVLDPTIVDAAQNAWIGY